MGKPNHNINIIGTRHGEKLFETLLSREEIVAAEDLGSYYRVPPDLRDINYSKYIEEGEPKVTETKDYNSHNAYRLGVSEVENLLLGLPFIRQAIIGEYNEPEV